MLQSATIEVHVLTDFMQGRSDETSLIDWLPFVHFRQGTENSGTGSVKRQSSHDSRVQ